MAAQSARELNSEAHNADTEPETQGEVKFPALPACRRTHLVESRFRSMRRTVMKISANNKKPPRVTSTHPNGELAIRATG